MAFDSLTRAIAIQNDFVLRYGDQVIAARSETPSAAIGIGVIVAMALAALALGLMMRRFLRRGRLMASGPSAEVAGDSAALDVRLDEELANLDR